MEGDTGRRFGVAQGRNRQWWGRDGLCPISCPLGPHCTSSFSQALDRQGRHLGFGVQGQRSSSSTHVSVLPASDTRPHLCGSASLWGLSGDLRGAGGSSSMVQGGGGG